jgi:vacuolar protein sorting-associated protein 54
VRRCVRVAQVLGAGAMRTAGLKSISAKHLAVAAQSLAALAAALPLLRAQLLGAVAEAPRRAMLLNDFERLAQVRRGFAWRVPVGEHAANAGGGHK